jgi:hypothetical protein
MIALIEDLLKVAGIAVVNIHGTDMFVPADAIFVHVDRSVISAETRAFALQYPISINAYATDIRKFRYADGLLTRDDSYDAPVIVKSNLNYAGLPERHAAWRDRTLTSRLKRRAARMLSRRTGPLIESKQDYRVFPTLSAVPSGYFNDDCVVQKFMPEMNDGKHVLREYIFLGDCHYQNIEQSDQAVITEDEHVSCGPFVPHPRLLAVRRQLGLQYGKIDFTLIDGVPFIFDANKTLGLGEYGDTAALASDFAELLKCFADELVRMTMPAASKEDQDIKLPVAS